MAELIAARGNVLTETVFAVAFGKSNQQGSKKRKPGSRKPGKSSKSKGEKEDKNVNFFDI